jgi:hypothetical protein
VKKFLLLLSVVLGLGCALLCTESPGSQPALADCPPEGSASQQRLLALNKLKNRCTSPAEADIDTNVTLKKMLEPGDDRKRWKQASAARITGYVYEVKPGGIETCNCKAKEPGKRDTHIELLADPMHDAKIQRVVVEVTPRLREMMQGKGEDWSTKKLRDRLLGRWVTFTGWLLFDEEHDSQAEHTAPGRTRNWRATAWEIHPVTKIEISKKP